MDSTTALSGNFLVVDRRVIGDSPKIGSGRTVIEFLANCECIRRDLKARLEDDVSPHFLVLDLDRMSASMSQQLQNRVMSILKSKNAIRNDIVAIEESTVFDKVTARIYELA